MFGGNADEGVEDDMAMFRSLRAGYLKAVRRKYFRAGHSKSSDYAPLGITSCVITNRGNPLGIASCVILTFGNPFGITSCVRLTFGKPIGITSWVISTFGNPSTRCEQARLV